MNFEFRAASFELDQNKSIHRIEDRNRGEFAGYTQEKTLNFRESVIVSVLDGSAPPSSNVFVMSNNTKGILFGGGARRVVVERNDEPDIGRDNGRIAGGALGPESSGASTSPFHVNQTGSFCRLSERRGSVVGVSETGAGVGCKSVERLVVPRTVERQGRQGRRSSGIHQHVLPVRRTSISHEYLPEARGAAFVSPAPFDPHATSRLSVSLAAARNQLQPLHSTGSDRDTRCRDQTQNDDPFLLSWLNSVLDPWGHDALSDSHRGRMGSQTTSVVAIHTHKDVLRDRMTRQWMAMGSETRAWFEDPLQKISERLAKNPLKVAKAMEAVVRTAVLKHQVMSALGSYSRVWFEMASDLVNSGCQALRITLSLHEREWLQGLVGRDAGKNVRLQAFSKLSPEGYCRIALHVTGVVLLLDRIFGSTAWSIPVWSPPLFCDETYVSSRDVLQSSLGLFLDEAADVHRWLQRSGYRVSYVQSPKLRPLFGVRNMAVDLRDGVVLCRLAELLVPGCERLKPLYPATRASERMRNVELALLKLGMGDYVEARLVADGNEAATTGLLWNCIVRFELENLLNVNAISAELRRLGGGIVVGCAGTDVHDPYLSFLLDAETEKHPAARYVLWWACCLYNTPKSGVIVEDVVSDHPLGGPDGRRRVLESFLAQYGSGMTIGGGSLARDASPESFTKRVDYLLKPLGKDHGMPRVFSEEELLYSNQPLDQRRLLVLYALLLKRVLSVHHEQRAATVIQRCWRRHVLDQRAPEFARKHLELWINAATVIQRNVRPYLARCRIEASRASRLLFVQRIVRIQAIWRQHSDRSRYQTMRNAAVVIQAHWRGYAARSLARDFSEEVKRRTAAAEVIQTRWRAFSVHRRFSVSKEACITIQSYWRMTVLRRDFVEKRTAAVVMQKHVRHMLVATELRARGSACLNIQTAWRMASRRSKFLAMRASAITIQSTWRMAVDRASAARRLEAAVTIQRQWRAVRQRELDEVAESLQMATADLVDALTEYANRARADLLVDKAESRRLDAARTIQAAWREYLLVQNGSKYLLEVYGRASTTVEMLASAAREDCAARTVQAAWRRHAVLRRISEYWMRVYEKSKETARLNEKYGGAVVKIQAHVRGYLVRTQHAKSPAMAAIRDQLCAATERANALLREGIEDPTTLGNMTRLALEGLCRGSQLPSVRVLRDLARCLGSSTGCCKHFINESGVHHLINALLAFSRDKMREDSVEQALVCIETLAACGRFSDRVGSVLLEMDGEHVKHLFQLLYRLKDTQDLFHALLGALQAVGKSEGFCRAVASSDLSGALCNVHRAISVKQSQVAMYLENLQGSRGSDVSISNATRALYKLERQASGLGSLIRSLGIESGATPGETATVSAPTPSRTANKENPMVCTERRTTNNKKTLPTSVSKNAPPGQHQTRRVLGCISNTRGF